MSAWSSVIQAIIATIALILAIIGFQSIKTIIVKNDAGVTTDQAQKQLIIEVRPKANDPLVQLTIEWWLTKWNEGGRRGLHP